MQIDKMKLRMGRPILVDKDSKTFVYPPRIGEIVDIGETTYNDLCLPYIINKDAIFGNIENGEEIASKFSMFELFFAEVGEGKYLLDTVFKEGTLVVLERSLRFFLKADDIRILENRQKIVVNKSYLIDSNEFNSLRKAIQGVTAKNDIVVEKPPRNMSKVQKDVWDKLQAGRKRKAEREAFHMQDLVNFIAFGGRSYIPTSEIEKMTYYEFDNAYKSIVSVDVYESQLGHHLSQKFDVKDKLKHWTETLRIGK